MLSPSLVHVTEGSGLPLTSHVKIARSPTSKMVLSGKSWMTGLSALESREHGLKLISIFIAGSKKIALTSLYISGLPLLRNLKLS